MGKGGNRLNPRKAIPYYLNFKITYFNFAVWIAPLPREGKNLNKMRLVQKATFLGNLAPSPALWRYVAWRTPAVGLAKARILHLVKAIFSKRLEAISITKAL